MESSVSVPTPSPPTRNESPPSPTRNESPPSPTRNESPLVPVLNNTNKGLEQSNLEHNEDRAMNEVQDVGGGGFDLDLYSFTVDESLDTDTLVQQLESITKKRQELQQMEIQLRAMIIARKQIMGQQKSSELLLTDNGNAGNMDGIDMEDIKSHLVIFGNKEPNHSHPEENVGKNVDDSHHFQTDQVFSSREELIDWCQDVGRRIGMVVITTKSEKPSPGRNGRLILGCERGGIYRRNKKCKTKPNALEAREMATKKCRCPFTLKGIPQGSDTWRVHVQCGLHNHERTSTLNGHSYAGRLNKTEREILEDMSMSGVRPRDILNTLKEHNVDNKSTMKTIYNAKARLRALEMQRRTNMHETMKLLQEHHYIEWYTVDEATHEVTNIFWAQPNSKRRKHSDESATNLQKQHGDSQKAAELAQSESHAVTESESTANLALTDKLPTDLIEKHDKTASSKKRTRGDDNFSTELEQQSVEPQKQIVPAESESLSLLEPEPTGSVDLTDTFTTDLVFDSREELIKWVRDTGKQVGTVIVVSNSDSSEGCKTHRIIFGCERGGKYRVKSKKGSKEKLLRRNMGTKKCECPFALWGEKKQDDDKWMVKVVCGSHNHQTQYTESLAFAGRLTPEVKAAVIEMTNSGVKPKEVFNVLKDKDMHNTTTMTTICNARSRMKIARACGKSQMQLLLKKLAEKEYVEWHRNKEHTDVVGDLFWAHQESIQLAKCFPHIILIDSTYKINRFRMPLLEIVGVTSTNKTFSFAFVYLGAEKEHNFVWALECMKSALDTNALPSILVTDKNVALMNAIKKVFPNARNLLCRYQISRNILTNCKKLFETSDVWKKFQSRWNDLVCSATDEEYSYRLSAFERDFSEYSGALSYVMDNFLSEYKECFIAAWTDKSIHFGNTTTCRAENSHAKLKRYLGSSQGNFDTWWSTIKSLLLSQHIDINASFERSVNAMMVSAYKSDILKELSGFISKAALDMVVTELVKADTVGLDNWEGCNCLIRQTYALPCVHEIMQYKYEGSSIPLSCVHPHWKQLSSLPTVTELHDLDYRPEVEMFVKRFEEADENFRLELLKKLEEISE